MGGIGSGTRWSTTTKLEETKRIDIRWLKQNNKLKPYSHGRLSWNCGGAESGSIQYEMYPSEMVLKYRHKSYHDDDWTSVKQQVQLVETACHLGGTRKWFACPRCFRRAAVLYSNSVNFECRTCTGLNYSSQSEDHIQRLARKRDKLAVRIFMDEDSYAKRKGMHTKKFDQLFDEWLVIDEMAENAFLEGLAPLLDRVRNLPAI
jgi:hypothetical protein